MTQKPLQIFLSYASEDHQIAGALELALHQAFLNKVKVIMMRDFENGSNWRNAIDESLEETDVLIAITTSSLKPGHSFTGYEIGCFTFSKRRKSHMKHHPKEKRLIIPFSVLDRAPGTITDYQGVELFPEKPHKIFFDTSDLGVKNGSSLRPEDNAAASSVYKFIGEINEIISRTYPDEHRKNKSNAPSQLQRMEYLKNLSTDLYGRIISIISHRERQVSSPKSRISIRIDPAKCANIDPAKCSDMDFVSDARITIQGPCYDAFGLPDIGEVLDWTGFTRAVDETAAHVWKESFNAVLRQNMNDSFFDHSTIISFNKKKTFRIFVSKVTTFYNGIKEYDLYVIELMKQGIYNDPRTIMLLSALEIGCSYRSMFFESESAFSPNAFKATNPKDFKTVVSQMVFHLETILQVAESAGLTDWAANRVIYGEDRADHIGNLMMVWEKEKGKIDKIIRQVITVDKVDEHLKSDFVEKLEVFCNATREMNADYTSSVMTALHVKVPDMRGAPIVLPEAVTAPGRSTSRNPGGIQSRGQRMPSGNAGSGDSKTSAVQR